jgi:Arc/MetJ family transcription regulator
LARARDWARWQGASTWRIGAAGLVDAAELLNEQRACKTPMERCSAATATKVRRFDDGRADVYSQYTSRRRIMRTNVVIDDQLMERALHFSGCRTKRAAIESGLRLLVQHHTQMKLRTLKGKIAWEGDLDEMRRD